MFEKVERMFTTDLQETVNANGGSYIDAIVDLCEKNDVEPAIAAKYLSKCTLFSFSLPQSSIGPSVIVNTLPVVS